MKNALKKVDARLAEIKDEIQALDVIASSEEGLDEAQSELLGELSREIDSLKAKRASFEKIQEQMELGHGAQAEEPKAEAGEPDLSKENKIALPARAAAKPKNFDSAEDAFSAGMYMLALAGDKRGEIFAAQNIGTDADGGFLVPDPLANSLINLLEVYGVARAKARRIVMAATTWTVPKLTEHATIYYVAEAGSITDSDLAFEQITLTAQKMAALVKMSTEVTEDAIISVMDAAVQSMAYQMAIEEDKNLFNGVAGGINTAGIKGDADVADTNVASAAALALSDLTACKVSLGNAIVGARNEWYMNKTLLDGEITDLLHAVGGLAPGDVANGTRPSLLGAPVNFVNVMPGSGASTSGDLLAVYGDMSMGAYFGDRRSLNFKVLNELFAVTDQVGVMCTERIDVKVANPEVLAKITIT